MRKRRGYAMTYHLIHRPAPSEGAEGSTMTKSSTPTAESLAGGPIEAARADKAPYARLRAQGRTLAYADDRKDGFVLNFASKDVEDAPARFQKSLNNGGTRATMHVTSRNVKGARALLEWLAKQ